jgi:hypothetical protein
MVLCHCRPHRRNLQRVVRTNTLWYCISTYLSHRADAASAVNKITGNIYKSCDFEYDCYRAFKMALLSGHVVIVNTRQ